MRPKSQTLLEVHIFMWKRYSTELRYANPCNKLIIPAIQSFRLSAKSNAGNILIICLLTFISSSYIVPILHRVYRSKITNISEEL